MNEAVHILLIEDNPGDVRLMKEALRESRLRCDLAVSPDGIDALARLRRRGPHLGAPRPDLVLLDLQLPKKDGIEILGEIKGDPALRSIPVVVLTSSADESDVARAYDLQANCYVLKPLDPGALASVVRLIEQFWLGIVRLPRS